MREALGPGPGEREAAGQRGGEERGPGHPSCPHGGEEEAIPRPQQLYLNYFMFKGPKHLHPGLNVTYVPSFSRLHLIILLITTPHPNPRLLRRTVASSLPFLFSSPTVHPGVLSSQDGQNRPLLCHFSSLSCSRQAPGWAPVSTLSQYKLLDPRANHTLVSHLRSCHSEQKQSRVPHLPQSQSVLFPGPHQASAPLPLKALPPTSLRPPLLSTHLWLR